MGTTKIIDMIAVGDKRGYRHMIKIEYQPWFGLAFAYHEDRIIKDWQSSRIHEPMSDSDREWERYEDSLAEFKEMAVSDLTPDIQEYLNSLP